MTTTIKLSRVLGLMFAASLVANLVGAADALSWRVSAADVRVICPLTVGGSFEAKTSILEGILVEQSSHPTVLGGSLSVDLRSLDTGIGLRNDHLRRLYLEVDKGTGYDEAVLSDIRLAGIDWETFQGKTDFTGTLLLHGTTKPVTGQAEIRRDGPTVRVDASFPLELTDFGIAKPQYLGVGVKNEVETKVKLVLSPELTAGRAR